MLQTFNVFLAVFKFFSSIPSGVSHLAVFRINSIVMAGEVWQMQITNTWSDKWDAQPIFSSKHKQWMILPKSVVRWTGIRHVCLNLWLNMCQKRFAQRELLFKEDKDRFPGELPPLREKLHTSLNASSQLLQVVWF